MEDKVASLVQEHYGILSRDEDIKQELVEELIKNHMTEFFQVSWSKLHREYVGGERKTDRKGRRE